MNGLDYRSTLLPGPGSPQEMKHHLRRLWKRYLKWPAPLWRLQGHARLSLGDHDFTFCIEDANLGWARRVQKGRWESPVRNFLKSVLRSGDMFFDVGAWIGPYTLLASKLVQPRGWVYSFEPDPVARTLLERNLDANHVSNVTVLPYAVSDHEGPAWVHSDRLGWSVSTVSQERGVVEAHTVTMDRFCKKQNIYPSVIKIDVEGGEAKVVAGALESLKRARVIILEFHEVELRVAGEDPSAFAQSLFSLDRRIIVLHQRGGGGELLKPGTELTRGIALQGTVHLAIL